MQKVFKFGPWHQIEKCQTTVIRSVIKQKELNSDGFFFCKFQIITADEAVMVNADEAIMVNADGEGVACFDVVGGTAGNAKVEPLPPMPADSFEGQAASVLPNHPTQFGTDHHALQVRIILSAT